MPRPSTGLLTGLGRERGVPLRGRITRQIASCCIARLLVLAVENPRGPVIIHISSPGGAAAEALSVISTMNGIRCPIAVLCRGEVGGAAITIAAHGLRGFRAAVPGCRFSFKTFIGDGAGMGNNSRFLQPLAELLARDTQQPQTETLAWLRDGAEFSAQQALAHGLIDKISSEPIMPKG